MTKRQKLLKLRSLIIDKILKARWEDVWFLPEYEGVKGYLGTKDILFLSINPSTGTFPSRVDKRYYKQLKQNEFKNAHLTDVFKQRATEWKKLAKDKDLVNEAKKFLEEEIKIIKPKLIVLVGKTYKKFYYNILSNVDAETFVINHYANRWGNAKKLRSRIRKEVRKAKIKYESL